jgi:hypothetical protein
VPSPLLINVPLQNGRCAAFYSLLGRQIMRRDANFKATNRFYCGHRESVCEIFPSLVDEVQVQARIQIHPCTHQFEPTSFELRTDCSTSNLAAWPTRNWSQEKELAYERPSPSSSKAYHFRGRKEWQSTRRQRGRAHRIDQSRRRRHSPRR